MSGVSHGSSARAILYAFLANAGIAVAKTWVAMVTGSGSLMAEAIHSYADSGNQVLLYLGMRQSRRPADSEHPLGYGKVSYFWSFIVALMLFSLGGLFSIYEGIHKLERAEPLEQTWIAIAVLVVAIVLESLSLSGCLREINKIRGERPFVEWVRHTRNSELMVVLGEDIAALLGLALALIFVSLAAVTGDAVFDAMGSICIGAILVVVSVFLTMRVRSLLVGRSADPLVQAAIDEVIGQDEDIQTVYNVITMQFGPDTLLAAKVRLRPGISIDAAVDIINELERNLKSRVPALKWSFIEPDTAD